MRVRGGVVLLAAALSLTSPARADHRYGPVFVLDPEQAHALIARGAVAPIDLRPESEFQTGRLPGARSLPLASLVARVGEVPPAGVVLIYADAPNERLLGAYHFIRARHAGPLYLLDGGLESWRRLGYELEH